MFLIVIIDSEGQSYKKYVAYLKQILKNTRYSWLYGCFPECSVFVHLLANGVFLIQLLALAVHFSHIPLTEMWYLLYSVYVIMQIRSYRAFSPENGSYWRHAENRTWIMLVFGHKTIFDLTKFKVILCEWKHRVISSDVNMAILQLR